MKKALMVASVLVVAVISTACINNIAVQELNNKAVEYMQKGDYESAMNRLQASLDLDATMYQTYYNLGVVAIKAKKYDKAIEALENGIKINPEYSDFFYSLGVAQISLADEISEEEIEEDTDSVSKDEQNGTEVKEIDIKKAVELKQNAVDNLTKYLEKVPSTNDKADIEKMIEESNEFIAKNSNEQKENEVKE